MQLTFKSRRRESSLLANMAQLDDAGFSVKLFFGCWFYFGVAFGVVDFTFQFTKKKRSHKLQVVASVQQAVLCSVTLW